MPDITEDALRAVRDRASLFDFLGRSLGWETSSDDTFTYVTPPQPGLPEDRVEVSRIVPFGGVPFVLMLAEFQTPFRRTDLRKLLQGVRRDDRLTQRYGGTSPEEIIFVCPVPDESGVQDYGGVSFAHFEEREGRAPKLKVFGWIATDIHVTRTLRDINLPALAMPRRNLREEYEWAVGKNKWLGAWDVEAVTREFFKDYKVVFHGVRDALPMEFAGDRTLFTQRLFNRLLFIHFLSQKPEGWLRFGERRDYLRALWEGRDTDTNFYRSRLRPLFFTALNHCHVRSLREDNPTLYALIGEVPYLNGGLFEKADDDDAILDVPDPALEKVLALFRQYRFTITESTPDDVEVAVDPEMLGKVFEELVTGRHESGSYYTPRPVVAFMCREALKGYLGDGSGIVSLVDGRNADGMTRKEAAMLLDKLAAVRVVDPACGSGAYLLGMLHELYELTGLLELRADPLSARDQYKRKLTIIQNALYGVDLDTFAVNVARLRLWLSLAVEHTGEVPEPLPNLDFKVETGDSLVSPLAHDDFISDLIRLGQIDELKAAKDEYGSPDFAGDRRQLHKKIKGLKLEIAAWLHQNDKKKDKTIDINKDTQIFEWQVEFAEVFKYGPEGKAGGFDIVLANPPYVRHQLIQNKPALQKLYASATTGTSDLYCYFYMRGLQLLRHGGIHIFICSGSWLDVGFGGKLQKYLLEEAQVKAIYDSAIERQFATAEVNTIISILQKDKPAETDATAFISLRKPFEEAIAASDARCEINVTRGELWGYGLGETGEYEGDSWGGKFLRGPKIYSLLTGNNGMSPVTKYATARLGLTTGANEFFFLLRVGKDQYFTALNGGTKAIHLPDEFFQPVIRTASECTQMTFHAEDTKHRVLLIDRKCQNPHIKAYIQMAEDSGIHMRPFFHGRKFWYENVTTVRSHIAVSEIIYQRYFYLWNEDGCILNKNFYGFDSRIPEDVLFSLLNFTFSFLFFELNSRKPGAGASGIGVRIANKLPVVNIESLNERQQHEIIEAGASIRKRGILDIFDEVKQPDRNHLDRVLLDVLCLPRSAVNDLYSALLELVERRLAKSKSLK